MEEKAKEDANRTLTGALVAILEATVTANRRTPHGGDVKLTKVGIECILIVLWMVVCASGGDPITIKLEGTLIDVLPETVEVFTENPSEAAEELVKKGGTRFEPVKNGDRTVVEFVMYRNVNYLFKMPEKTATADSNHQFKPGDITYIFNVETQEEASSFAKRYQLKKTGTIPVGRKTKDLYVAKPGFFVYFLIKTTIYYCPLHRNQESDLDGMCPICGMPFAKTNWYR